MKLTENKASQKPFWEIKAAADKKKTGEAYIYGYIVSYKWDDADVTAASFKKDLDNLGEIDTLNVYVNSGGGSVFQAQAIHSILKRHTAKKNVYIDGIAASAASFLIMAGDTIYMPKNATVMVHNPMNIVYGNAQEMRKEADALDKIRVGMIEAYMSKIGDKITEDKLKELLDAESWLTAQECLEYGLVDELVAEKNVAASIDPEVMELYKNVPERLKNKLTEGVNNLSEAERKAIIEESQKIINKTKKDMEVM